MKKDDNTFSCLVAVCAFAIAGFIGILIFVGGSDNGTQSSPDPQVALQVKKNQVEQYIKSSVLQNRQAFYETFHGVAAGWGGMAKDVEVTNFEVDDSLSNCRFRLTIYWSTMMTPNGFTEMSCRATNTGSGWQIDPKSISLINTNGMTDNEFWSGVGAAAVYLLL